MNKEMKFLVNRDIMSANARMLAEKTWKEINYDNTECCTKYSLNPLKNRVWILSLIFRYPWLGLKGQIDIPRMSPGLSKNQLNRSRWCRTLLLQSRKSSIYDFSINVQCIMGKIIKEQNCSALKLILRVPSVTDGCTIESYLIICLGVEAERRGEWCDGSDWGEKRKSGRPRSSRQYSPSQACLIRAESESACLVELALMEKLSYLS